MKAIWSRTVVIAVFAAACNSAVGGDRYGDPLPDNAIARLGTIRLRHQTSPTNGVAFSRDGTMLVIGGYGGEVTVWERATGKLIRRFGSDAVVDDRYVTCTISPNGTEVLTLSLYKRVLNRWNIKTGKKKAYKLPNVKRVDSATFSADGSTLAIYDGKDTIVVFATAAGVNEMARIGVKGHRTRKIALSADGAKLTFLSEKSVCVWDVSTKTALGTITPGKERYKAVVFTADGKQIGVIVESNKKRALVFYDCATLKEDRRTPVSRVTDIDIAVSPDRKILASGYFKSVALRDLENHKKDLICKGGSQPLFSPDGKTLAVFSRIANVDYALRLWNVKTGKESPAFAAHACDVIGMGVSKDGKTVVTLDEDGFIFNWDVATQTPSQRGKLFIAKALAITPDGKFTAAIGQSFAHLGKTFGAKKLKRVGLIAGWTTQAKISPDGKLLIVGGDSSCRTGGLCGFSIPEGQEQFRVKFKEGIRCLAVSPDSKTIACWDDQDIMRLLSAKDGSVIKEVKQPGNMQRDADIAFSPDGKVLAVAGGSLVCYDAGTLKPLKMEFDTKATSGGQHISGIAFSSDGALLAAGSIDGSIFLYDANTGKTKARIAGHRGRVNVVAFSNEDKKLYSASSDSTVLIWDLTRILKN